MHFYLGPFPSFSLFQSAIIFCFILLQSSFIYISHPSLRIRLEGYHHLHWTDGETEAQEIKWLLISSFWFLLTTPLLGFVRDLGAEVREAVVTFPNTHSKWCPGRSPNAPILSLSALISPIYSWRLVCSWIFHSFIYSGRSHPVPLRSVRMWRENWAWFCSATYH